MTSPTPQPSASAKRDAEYWAQLATATLTVREIPPGAVNLNVAGRRVLGPLQGFGPLWKKTYSVRLTGRSDLAPAEIVRIWKTEFPRFWPRGERFFASSRGIMPGEVALLNLKAGGLPLETGMLVLYADDECFTLMTPQGHMYASWITFSAYHDDAASCPVAQVQMLLRTGDPVFALIMRFGGFRFEDGIWRHTLRALAAHFEVAEGDVQAEAVCLDPRIQWVYVSNFWYNAGMRTAFYTASAPLRWVVRRLPRLGRKASQSAEASATAPEGEGADNG
jgi:hypothetical protein